MSNVGSLIAFGLRQVVDNTVGSVLDRIEAHFSDHSQTLPAALARANERSWQAVGLALGGGGLFGWFKGLFAGGDLKAVSDLLREFLDRTPTGLEATPADRRARCQEEWQRLYRSGRLTISPEAARQLARQAGDYQRFTDLPGLVGEAQRAVAQVAGALETEAPHLAAVLSCTPPDGGPPLLVAAFLFFFRREVEDNAALARGLTLDSLRQLSAQLDHGLRALEQVIHGLGGRLNLLFTALAEGFDRLSGELGDIRETLARFIEDNQVRTSPTSPLGVSVTSEQERDRLRRLRDRLRQLPPGLVQTEDWLRLGDGLAAAGEFDDARASHQQAAAAAQAAADRVREAEGHFKTYRDACEQREWADALAALQRAVALDAARFRPFDLRRYEIVSILGAGGFGTVFRARDRYRRDASGQPVEVALKTLHTADLARDLDEVFAEAHVLNRLRHDGIIQVIDQNFADADGQQRPYLVLEYFAAPTLEAYLRHKGPLPLDEVLAIARQVAAAVHAAHQARVFHRDLKPANLLARRHPDGSWQVKVIDFGLAVRVAAAVQASSVLAGAKGALRDQSFAGTMDYAAPEQRGKLKGVSVGPYSDVYGFGKTCLDALFQTTEVVSDHWDELDDPRRDAVRKLLEKCIVTDLKRRFGNFEPVLAELEALDPARRREAEARRQAEEERQRREQHEAERRERDAVEQRQREEQERQRQELARQALDRTGGKPATEDTAAANDLIRQHHLPKERAQAIVREVRERWQKEQPREPRPGDLTTIDLGNSIAMKFAWIPPGEFLMGGNAYNHEKPIHRVAISQGFYFGIHPVTQVQWQAVMGSNPSRFQGDDRPVEMVSWSDCDEFCAKMRKLTGKPIRLPTEAEWEYACRAGTTTEYYSGDGEEALKKVGWYGGNSNSQTHPVGKLAANKWGLFDTHGNVWEWCADRYGPYPEGNIKDPQGVNNGDARVVRGGSWDNLPESCRAAYRYRCAPAGRNNSIGLRVCFRLD